MNMKPGFQAASARLTVDSRYKQALGKTLSASRPRSTTNTCKKSTIGCAIIPQVFNQFSVCYGIVSICRQEYRLL